MSLIFMSRDFKIYDGMNLLKVGLLFPKKYCNFIRLYFQRSQQEPLAFFVSGPHSIFFTLISFFLYVKYFFIVSDFYVFSVSSLVRLFYYTITVYLGVIMTPKSSSSVTMIHFCGHKNGYTVNLILH